MPPKVDDKEVRERDSSGVEQKDRKEHREHRERRKHRSSRSKRKDSSRDDLGSSLRERSSTLADSSHRRKSSMPIPELQRRASSISPNGSRLSLPYPSFSKAHSREAVGSKDNLSIPARKSPLTPDPTDLEQRKNSMDGREEAPRVAQVGVNGPPSPPLTATEQAADSDERRHAREKTGEDVRKKLSERIRDMKSRSTDSLQNLSAKASPVQVHKPYDGSSTSRRSRNGTPIKNRHLSTGMNAASSTSTTRRKSRSSSPSMTSKTEIETTTDSTIDSEATSVASKQPAIQIPFRPDGDDGSSPATGTDSSPKTPTPRGTPFQMDRKFTPGFSRPASVDIAQSVEDSPSMGPPPPPPPPPPPNPQFTAPRVDYLIQNGGLPHSIPKQFLAAPNPTKPVSYDPGTGLPNLTAMATQVQSFFSPFSTILDDYTKVMGKNGSIAVATGYRSIARRLLDRLEAVFARDISSQSCECIMCTQDANHVPASGGVSWGEILEYVSGRQDLPQWPPFVLEQDALGFEVSPSEITVPCQKLDIDVPEEYREHYIRQSKKTKQSVDRWLAGQLNDSNPPDEADDDTLTFAILTHLTSLERPLFTQLLGVQTSRPPSIRPDSRTATPLNQPKPELITRTSLAVQRLYRLARPPRAPECAIYLLNNQPLHDVLATLAHISDAEWDILISGRFDGFLRSGAEDLPSPGPGIPSRGPTPSHGASISRGATPSGAIVGAPVAMDEETEIAVLAEVEREIYLGMEVLEDAFEALHLRAEEVRRALRERGAGLSMAAQARKGSAANILEIRLGTPSTMAGDSETDDGIDDSLSEIRPDDSASNVSSSRHRRPKRRTERRTPAPVEEEDESDYVDGMKSPQPHRANWSRNSLRNRR